MGIGRPLAAVLKPKYGAAHRRKRASLAQKVEAVWRSAQSARSRSIQTTTGTSRTTTSTCGSCSGRCTDAVQSYRAAPCVEALARLVTEKALRPPMESERRLRSQRCSGQGSLQQDDGPSHEVAVFQRQANGFPAVLP